VVQGGLHVLSMFDDARAEIFIRRKHDEVLEFSEGLVPVSVEGMTLSHCPVSFPRRIDLRVSQSKSARIEDRGKSCLSVRQALLLAVTAFRTDW
jgi:hypothetical protein